MFFGLGDFLGVGTSVGFAIVIPLLFVTYLGNGNILVFVSSISIITYNSYSHPPYGSPAGKVLAGLCAATGGSFVVNLVMTCDMRGAYRIAVYTYCSC